MIFFFGEMPYDRVQFAIASEQSSINNVMPSIYQEMATKTIVLHSLPQASLSMSDCNLLATFFANYFIRVCYLFLSCSALWGLQNTSTLDNIPNLTLHTKHIDWLKLALYSCVLCTILNGGKMHISIGHNFTSMVLSQILNKWGIFNWQPQHPRVVTVEHAIFCRKHSVLDRNVYLINQAMIIKLYRY